MPKPNATWPWARRRRSKRSGSSQRRGSRFAAARNSSTFSPAPIRTPLTVTSRVVVRKNVCTGDAYRSDSSNAAPARVGSSRSSCHWAGSRARQSRAQPSPITVVSTPAVSSDRTSSAASSAEIVPSSTLA